MKYVIGDFMNSHNVYISSAAQNMPLYPLSLSDAKNFFKYFKYESFDFDGIVKSIDIRTAKYNLPRSSWADGFLYSKTLDELDLIVEKCNTLPNFVGFIHLAYGGHRESPHVQVEKLPYLFWNNGKLQVPPCSRCGSSFTNEYHNSVSESHYDIYTECMECGKKELQGNFVLTGGNTFVKLSAKNL